eukprot:8405524-Alexandrium_andersonii.AAC.1
MQWAFGRQANLPGAPLSDPWAWRRRPSWFERIIADRLNDASSASGWAPWWPSAGSRRATRC